MRHRARVLYNVLRLEHLTQALLPLDRYYCRKDDVWRLIKWYTSKYWYQMEAQTVDIWDGLSCDTIT